LIDDDLRNDLTVIKDIRNEFAHSVTTVNFSSLEIIEYVKKFKGFKTTPDDGWSFFYERIVSCIEQIDAKQEQGLMADALRDE
jgi:hypothetical protein